MNGIRTGLPSTSFFSIAYAAMNATAAAQALRLFFSIAYAAMNA